MEEHDQETETEQQTGEQDDHENDSTAEAKRTGIKTTAPLIKGNPANKSASYMVKFLDEAVHYLRESKSFRDDAREERSRADFAGKHPCAPAIDASSLSLAIDSFAWLCAPTRTP